MPWNTGYITNFWSKFESGEKTWDTTIDRKAGGAVLSYDKDVDVTTLKFSVVSSSSLMALMRAVLGHVVRTGQCPPDLALAFKSIKITWLFESTEQEILTMSVNDNIDQHNRRKHTELDNIFQVKAWMEAMTKLPRKPLDNTKAVDIVKFALAQGNPLKPDEVPEWLQALLNNKPPTFHNKIEAMCTRGVTKRFLEDKKAKIMHPEMFNYLKVVMRVRAVNGFHEFELIHQEITEEIGRRGLAHKPYPLTASLLLDPNILTSDAFAGNEKNSVPQWRDGCAGRELQKAMVEVLRRRLFDHSMINTTTNGGKMVFANGSNWAAYARLNGPPHYHMDTILEKNFDQPTRWADSVKAFHAGLWTGDHDTELCKLNSLLPAPLDAQPSQMQKRLCDMFPPLLHLLQTKESEAARLASSKEQEDAARKKDQEEDEK